MSDAERAFYDDYWSDAQPPPLLDPLTPRRRELLLRVLQREGARRVLDVGAGDGALMLWLAERGYDVEGLEISPNAVARARALDPTASLVVHGVEDLPWPVDAGGFDVVTSFEVIEHLLRPRALVQGAATALRPNGCFVFSTPFHGLLKNVALAVGAFDSHYAVEGPHIRFFTDRALKMLLEQCGFDLVETAHLGRVWGLWANVVVTARKRP